MATMSRPATGAGHRRSSAASAQRLSTLRLARLTGRGCEPATWASSHDGELFIVGRIKDLLIIRGRNHYPEDIEATVQEITRGRVAAISVPLNSTEKLVTVIELKKRRNLNGRRDALAQ